MLKKFVDFLFVLVGLFIFLVVASFVVVCVAEDCRINGEVMQHQVERGV